MSMRPPGTDSAPYFKALVASSCTTIASGCAVSAGRATAGLPARPALSRHPSGRWRRSVQPERARVHLAARPGDRRRPNSPRRAAPAPVPELRCDLLLPADRSGHPERASIAPPPALSPVHSSPGDRPRGQATPGAPRPSPRGDVHGGPRESAAGDLADRADSVPRCNPANRPVTLQQTVLRLEELSRLNRPADSRLHTRAVVRMDRPHEVRIGAPVFAASGSTPYSWRIEDRRTPDRPGYPSPRCPPHLMRRARA